MFEQISIDGIRFGEGGDLLVRASGSIPQQLLAERMGTAQVVYIDPPFMTGDTFDRRRRFGAKGWRTGSPAPAYPGYTDCYTSRDAYVGMLRGFIENAWLLLRMEGMLCLHIDRRMSHVARMICDEVFGESCFVNEIIWSYESGGRSMRHFSYKHDTILMYGRSKDYTFDITRVPLKRGEVRHNHMRRGVDEDGRAYSAIRSGGKEYRYYDDEPVYPGDVWTDISHIQQRSPERTGYPTQKPLELLKRLLLPLVQEGDLVMDLCCGSGTSLVAAQQLGCRVLGLDLSPEALLITADRLDRSHLTLSVSSARDAVPLRATCVPEIGMMTLEDFPAEHRSFPANRQPLDVLESWCVGDLQNGTLRVKADFRRSIAAPDLNTMCVLPEPVENLAIAAVDASGLLRAYVWKDE